MEIWKDVVGYEGMYQVSNLGNIKRLERISNFKSVNQYKEYKTTRKIKERLNNIINSIDTRLIEMGVDDEMLDICEMYDVNGIELRKMIKELKGSDKE